MEYKKLSSDHNKRISKALAKHIMFN